MSRLLRFQAIHRFGFSFRLVYPGHLVYLLNGCIIRKFCFAFISFNFPFSFQLQGNDKLKILWYQEHDLSLIFPLIYRPFGHIWINTPFHPVGFLNQQYTSFKGCMSTGFLHDEVFVRLTRQRRCSDYVGEHAMVQRCPPSELPWQLAGFEIALINERLCTRNKAGVEHVVHDLTLPAPRNNVDHSFDI